MKECENVAFGFKWLAARVSMPILGTLDKCNFFLVVLILNAEVDDTEDDVALEGPSHLSDGLHMHSCACKRRSLKGLLQQTIYDPSFAPPCRSPSPSEISAFPPDLGRSK